MFLRNSHRIFQIKRPSQHPRPNLVLYTLPGVIRDVPQTSYYHFVRETWRLQSLLIPWKQPRVPFKCAPTWVNSRRFHVNSAKRVHQFPCVPFTPVLIFFSPKVFPFVLVALRESSTRKGRDGGGSWSKARRVWRAFPPYWPLGQWFVHNSLTWLVNTRLLLANLSSERLPGATFGNWFIVTS